MRITGGTHRGRSIKAPTGQDVRPTSDKIRQAIFNMLDSRGGVADDVVIDSFCGTGALGLEALSRGAAFSLFVDKSGKSLQLAKDNVRTLGVESQTDFLKADSTQLKANDVKSFQASLVFCDPPYRKNMITPCLRSLAEGGWLAPVTTFVLESEKDWRSDISFADLEWSVEKIYGDTKITLCRGTLA